MNERRTASPACMCTHARADGRTDGRTGGGMDGWMDGWREGWMDGWMPLYCIDVCVHILTHACMYIYLTYIYIEACMHVRMHDTCAHARTYAQRHGTDMQHVNGTLTRPGPRSEGWPCTSATKYVCGGGLLAAS